MILTEFKERIQGMSEDDFNQYLIRAFREHGQEGMKGSFLSIIRQIESGDSCSDSTPLENWNVSNVTSMYAMFRDTPFNQPKEYSSDDRVGGQSVYTVSMEMMQEIILDLERSSIEYEITETHRGVVLSFSADCGIVATRGSIINADEAIVISSYFDNVHAEKGV